MGLGQPAVGKRARQNSENDNNTNASSHSTSSATDLNEEMWILMNKRARELSPDFNMPQGVQATSHSLPIPRMPLMGFESCNNRTSSVDHNTTTPSNSNVGNNATALPNTFIGSSSFQMSDSEMYSDCTDGSISSADKIIKNKLNWPQNMDTTSLNGIQNVSPKFVAFQESDHASYIEASLSTSTTIISRAELPTLNTFARYGESTEDYFCDKSSSDPTSSSQSSSPTNSILTVFKTVKLNSRAKGPRLVIKHCKTGKMALRTSISKDSAKSSSSNSATSVEDSEDDECSDDESPTRNAASNDDIAEYDDEETLEDDEIESDSYDFIPLSTEPPVSLPGLRPSLFPFVPPYIHFCHHNEISETIPLEIRKKLKWRLSPITPVVVKKTVEASGFRLLKNTVEWTGQWGRHMKASLFRSSVKDYQKLNHLPGTFQIGRKDRLWKNCQRFMLRFGKDEFGFIPRTYVLPKETKQLKQAWFSSETKGNPWIVKPPAGARGTGIRVINKWAQVPKKKPMIVQKYIQNPLLIDDRKFDLRLYILVTSMHPLKIYLYNDGLVRFAPVKYSNDSTRVSDRYMHLTNYSINKNCELYTQNEDAEACVGHKWTLKALWRYLREKGKDVDTLLLNIQDIVIKTILCAEDPITSVAFNMPNRYTGYELFGFDVILDDNLKPWLLEVNISPSLHSNSPLDLAVKGPLIAEVFNIVGYHLPPHLSSTANGQKNIFRKMNQPLMNQAAGSKFNIQLYCGSLSKQAKEKHSEFRTHYSDKKKDFHEILNELTSDDVRQLITASDELSQCSGFQRVFPSTTTHEYFPYFEGPRYYNMLLDAWEHKYSNNIDVGIQRLVELCSTKMHYQGLSSLSSGAKATFSDPVNPIKMEFISSKNSETMPTKTKIATGGIEDSNYCSLSASESSESISTYSTDNLFVSKLHNGMDPSPSSSCVAEVGDGHQDAVIITKADYIQGVC